MHVTRDRLHEAFGIMRTEKLVIEKRFYYFSSYYFDVKSKP